MDNVLLRQLEITHCDKELSSAICAGHGLYVTKHNIYFYKLQTGKRMLSYCCPREAAVVWSDDGFYLVKTGPITVDIDRLITNLYNNKISINKQTIYCNTVK